MTQAQMAEQIKANIDNIINNPPDTDAELRTYYDQYLALVSTSPTPEQQAIIDALGPFDPPP